MVIAARRGVNLSGSDTLNFVSYVFVSFHIDNIWAPFMNRTQTGQASNATNIAEPFLPRRLQETGEY
jgi:hypothetical protein